MTAAIRLDTSAPIRPVSTNDNVVVRLEGVTKTYQHDSVAVNAVSGIDLEIRKGDFAVLVGPSGSGKTTLLNMIGGLGTPTSGPVGGRIGRDSGPPTVRSSMQSPSQVENFRILVE